MKRIMLAVAMAAMLALWAVPALAAQNFEFFDSSFEQEAESGDIELSNEVSSSGDNSNQCAPVLQFGNTGNLQNQTGLVQYAGDVDDFELEGSSFVFEPEQATECVQSVEQAAAAGSAW